MTGAEQIAAERLRQRTEEGHTDEGDDDWKEGQLARAAVCYAVPPEFFPVLFGKARFDGVPAFWPWNRKWFNPKPADRVKDLVRSGALLAAEIDRIDRETEERARR